MLSRFAIVWTEPERGPVGVPLVLSTSLMGPLPGPMPSSDEILQQLLTQERQCSRCGHRAEYFRGFSITHSGTHKGGLRWYMRDCRDPNLYWGIVCHPSCAATAWPCNVMPAVEHIANYILGQFGLDEGREAPPLLDIILAELAAPQVIQRSVEELDEAWRILGREGLVS